MTQQSGLPQILQPAPERLIWPLIIGIASIAIGANEFVCAVIPLIRFYPGDGMPWPRLWGDDALAFAVAWAKIGAGILVPALELLAGLCLLLWRRPALTIVYAFVAISWGIAFYSYIVYDLFTSDRFQSLHGPYLLKQTVWMATYLAFPILLVFWYYTGRPSRQLRQWRAGAN